MMSLTGSGGGLNRHDDFLDCYMDMRLPQDDVGRGFEHLFTATLRYTCRVCDGSGVAMNARCQLCAGRGYRDESERLKIRLPHGWRPGQKLRLGGQGYKSDSGVRRGDLILTMRLYGDGAITETVKKATPIPTALPKAKPVVTPPTSLPHARPFALPSWLPRLGK